MNECNTKNKLSNTLKVPESLIETTLKITFLSVRIHSLNKSFRHIDKISFRNDTN